MLSLSGCETKGNTPSSSKATIIAPSEENTNRREQFLSIYANRAVIIEPNSSSFRLDGSYYKIPLDNGHIFIPMAQFIYFTVDSSITAEEYVSIACGPDFPIEYIRGEDYNKSR